jgi:hypothetical protein
MILPFAFGLSLAGTAVAVVAGALLVGLALAATAPDRERRTLPISTHHAFDHGLALGLLGAAAVLGLAGLRADAAFLALAAIAQLSLALTTRYSLRG